MKTEEYVIENQEMMLVINQVLEGQEVSTLLRLYFLVKAGDVLGLTEFIEDILKKSGIYERLEAVENGETGVLTDNPHEMNFTDLSNIDVIRGNYDETNKGMYC